MKIAVCMFGNMHTDIPLDHLGENFDIFACVNTTIPPVDRISYIAPSTHLGHYQMMERVMFLKREREMFGKFEYDTVILCRPENVQYASEIKVPFNKVMAQVSVIKHQFGRNELINPNMIAGTSLTMDIVSLFNQHIISMSTHVHANVTCSDNIPASLFYDYICSRQIDYENCSLYQRAS